MSNKNYVYYDLETNGLDYYTTGIMQMTILDDNGEILLNEYVYPFDKRIAGTEIHKISLETLVANKAMETVDLCSKIKQILRSKYGRNDVYLVAYNNFGYDQIILENNFRICGVKMPSNWYFVDLMPMVKEVYQANKLSNYKLKTVYEFIFGRDGDIDYHSSLADTVCLYKVFKHLGGIMGPLSNSALIAKYTRTLLGNFTIFRCPISALNGYTNGMKFKANRIENIGDLYDDCLKMNFVKDEIDCYLQYKLDIYSAYYRNNIVNQLFAIKHLQQ
jgi:DNA polymerase III epsilon subunit-like protein